MAEVGEVLTATGIGKTDKAPSVSPKEKSFLAEIWVSSNVFPLKRWVYFHDIEYFIKFSSSKGNPISQIFITYLWQLRHSVSTVQGGVYKINKTFSPAPYLYSHTHTCVCVCVCVHAENQKSTEVLEAYFPHWQYQLHLEMKKCPFPGPALISRLRNSGDGSKHSLS